MSSPVSTRQPRQRVGVQYHPPNSNIGKFFWRFRMWFEATFVFSMLEPWEKILLLTIFTVLSTLLFTGLVKYLPQHIMIMQRRASYYLWGQEGDERLLWQLFGGYGAGPTKDL